MNWTEKFEFNLTSEELTICDVRFGPTDDKITLSLPVGVYDVCYGEDEAGIAVRLVLSSKSVDKIEKTEHKVLVDQATIGIYESLLYSKVFNSCSDEFYFWGEENISSTDSINLLYENIYPFVVVNTKFDGVFSIYLLYESGNIVGLDIMCDRPPLLDAQDDPHILVRFDLGFHNKKINLWVFFDYDEETVMECLLDAIREDLEDLDREVIGEDEIKIDENKSVGYVDNSFFEMSSFTVTMLDDNDVEICAYNLHDSVEILNFNLTPKNISNCIYVKLGELAELMNQGYKRDFGSSNPNE